LGCAITASAVYIASMAGEISPYKCEFIEFMVRSKVLTFGDFVTKSGRKTPYFVNTGRYRTGGQLTRLSEFYGRAIRDQLGSDFDILFGPAYKGIPLAAATAMTLVRDHGHDVGFCFNRKEAKDHGEGGALVGCVPQDGDRVVIIEDVTTAGTSIRETVPVLRAAADIQLSGLVVSVDRMERGTGDATALAEIASTWDMPTFAIVTVEEIMEHLRGREVDGEAVLSEDSYERMLAYREEFGPR
jgi:orotate phosphoribosyltransferase